MSFLAFTPHVPSPGGEQVAGWSLAAGWDRPTIPPLMSLKKQESDKDNERYL